MCKFKKVLQGKELYLDIPHQLISEDIRTLLELEVEELSTVFGCEVIFKNHPLMLRVGFFDLVTKVWMPQN